MNKSDLQKLMSHPRNRHGSGNVHSSIGSAVLVFPPANPEHPSDHVISPIGPALLEWDQFTEEWVPSNDVVSLEDWLRAE